MSKPVEATPVYFHDCPVLGPHARVVEATMLSKDGKVLLGHQYKCVFCSYTVGEFRPALGVTVISPGKYSVDMSKAILTEPAA